MSMLQADDGEWYRLLLGESAPTEQANHHENRKPHGSSEILCLRRRFAGATYPNAVLLFQVNPLGLRA